MIAFFCALRPSELFALTRGSYEGGVFKIMNTAWRGQLQPEKIQTQKSFWRLLSVTARSDGDQSMSLKRKDKRLIIRNL
jgi:hypothetical protein